MKHLNLIYNLLLLPLAILIHNILSEEKYKHSHARPKKLGLWYLKSFSIIYFLILAPNVIYAASYSCNGQKVDNIHHATTDAYKEYITNTDDHTTRYWKFKTYINGTITISQKTNKPESGYYNHNLDIGTSCDGNDIYDGSNKSSDSHEFNVVANTTYYVKVTEGNSKNELNFDITFDFVEEDTTVYDCSNPHAFEKRINTVVAGDLIAIGNSNICADNDRDGMCDDDQAKRNDIGNGGNNIIFIDANSSTEVSGEPQNLFNTTAAELELPEGATIKWAGLYWQGEIWDIKNSNKSQISANQYNGNDVTIENGADGQARKALADKIKFKMPGGDYEELTADEHYYVFLKRTTSNTKDDYSGINRYEMHYQSFIDVTDKLQSLSSADGNYSVADMQATVGALHYPGVEAAWNLQVIYEYPSASTKSITITDGYVALYGSASQGDDYANAIAGCSTGGTNTGVYAYSIDFDVDGFLTPKKSGFTTDMSIFITESDPDGNAGSAALPEQLSITKEDNSLVLVDGPEAWAYEITNKDGSNNLNRTPDYIYPIGMTIKNYRLTDALDTEQSSTHVTFETDSDRLLIGVIGFSTELRVPDLCYDYAYEQSGRFFTEDNDGSQAPSIKGDLFSSDSIDVSLFIKNQEDSDVTISNLYVNVDPIDTVQGTYISGTTEITLPGEILRTTPSLVESTGSIQDIEIGDLLSQEYFYTYYSISPKDYSIDMPINVQLDFNTSITIPNGGGTFTSPYTLDISEMSFCADENYTYSPTYAEFNVEQKDNLSTYNLNTQVSKRVDDFEVTSYDPDSTTTRKNVFTTVAIELIDAGAFHEIDTACQQPDTALTPRLWVTFDNNVSATDFTEATIQNAIDNNLFSEDILNQTQTINSPEDFYAKVRRNTAFRISVNKNEDGDELIELSAGNCQGNQTGPCYEVGNFPDLNQIDVGNGAGNCASDIDGNANSNDKIPQYCGNSGAKGLDQAALAVCMECIYGHNLRYYCSRDNFAIRPEAFKVSLTDDNTSTVNVDFANNTDKSGSTGSPIDLAAGYPYRIDINATSHTDENAIEGYVQSFDSSDPTKVARMQWSPGLSGLSCNEPYDRNMTFYLVNGTNTNNDPINTWEDNHDTLDNVGKYVFKITDEEWTKYDWDSELTSHHTGSHYSTDADCTESDSGVTSVGNKVGCQTSSIHTASYATFTDVNIRSHPYSYNLSNMGLDTYPNTGNTWLYMNNLNNDTTMSAGIEGNMTALGYDNTLLSNYTTGCWADDIALHIDTDSTPSNIIDEDGTTISTLQGIEELDNSYTISNIDTNASFVKTHFADDQNGTANVKLIANIQKPYDKTINVTDINFTTLSAYGVNETGIYVEGKNNYQTKGSTDINQSKKFFYAKVGPLQGADGKQIYSPTTTYSTLLIVDTYCVDDATTGLNCSLITEFNGRDETFPTGGGWYRTSSHSSLLGDGEIISLAESPSVTSFSISPNANIGLDSNGSSSSISFSYPAANRPVSPIIQITPDQWLRYNPDTSKNGIPEFTLYYLPTGLRWKGVGHTGNVVQTEPHNSDSSRLAW